MRVVAMVQREKGLDFSGYKQGVLMRRVSSRFQVTGSESFRGYAAYLRRHPGEWDKLLKALTVNVTKFFRDEAVFGAISEKVIPEIIESKASRSVKPVRLWSCGCADGSEAVSLLIMLAERLGDRLGEFRISITATDIDRESLARAREGVYEEARLGGMDPALRARYFLGEPGGRYALRSKWKGLIRVKHHDAAKDEPFTGMDLIVCRNMLIFLSRSSQEDILAALHRALGRDGFLVLGLTESLRGRAAVGFETFDGPGRIFRKS